MTQVVRAVFEKGVLRPLDALALAEHQQVRITVESPDIVTSPLPATGEDPLAGLSVSTGIEDLAEHFDDYRHGTKTP